MKASTSCLPTDPWASTKRFFWLASALLAACVEPLDADVPEQKQGVELTGTSKLDGNSTLADETEEPGAQPAHSRDAAAAAFPTGILPPEAATVPARDAGVASVLEGGPVKWVEACWNHPASTFQSEAWVAPPVDPANLVALVEHTRTGVIGKWRGVVATPWLDPYDVDLDFRADGGYSAHCSGVANDCCIAFYYGTNADADIKRYRIEDATLSGNVTGEIDIGFGYSGNVQLPAWQGILSHVELDASGNRLRFEFRTSDGYGPLRYDLRRVGGQ